MAESRTHPEEIECFRIPSGGFSQDKRYEYTYATRKSWEYIPTLGRKDWRYFTNNGFTYAGKWLRSERRGGGDGGDYWEGFLDDRDGTGGSADRLTETFNGLLSSFGYALVIIYLLLVALYRSWSQPLVILTAVPLGVCGALLSLAAVHWVAPVEFDTIAMLGMILLAGVVVNTSILIVSQAEELLAQGLAPRDALREAAASRLRPILMSVITSVIGMLPLAAGQGSGSELYRGLGVVMVGGMVLSTLFVPIVVPALLATRARWRG